MITRLRSNHHFMLWGMFLLGLLIRGWGLSEQPPLDDEVGAALDAANYIENGHWSSIMWEHPPLRNIVIYLSAKLFGEYSSWGLRFGSVLFGSLAIPAVGYLSYGLFQKNLTACLAAFFLCIDPLNISLSRQAFQETTTAFFIVAGVLASLHGIKRDNLLFCGLSGVLFGIAAASKWHGLFPLTVSACAYLIYPWVSGGQGGERRFSLRLLSLCAVYVAIPSVVYVAAHTPWLLRGHSLHEFANFQVFLSKAHYYHKASRYAEDYLAHRAYLWFVIPVVWNDFVFSSGRPYLNIAAGNYFIWVLTLPSGYFVVKRWVAGHRFEEGYLLAIFIFSYMPLLLTSRGIWVFNSLAVLPFAFILISYAINSLMNSGKLSLRALVIYLLFVSVISSAMYPMSTFRTLDYPWLRTFAEIYSPHYGAGR
ncbi:MAG: glycosyltransferase family 39 protein [Nitrospirae bacterium]|nr:glycosyltransferase family 39 protein [Nitrospirota bacterium]